VPPLKSEVYGLLTPGKNPFFDHAEAQYFLARRGNKVVGRISAHFDKLALAQPVEQGMGPGTGNFGLFEAEDAETGAALIAAAEGWLKAKGMTVLRSPQRGDMYVEIVVETPMNLTKKQKELLQEFEAAGSAEKTSPEAAGFFSRVKELWTDLKS